MRNKVDFRLILITDRKVCRNKSLEKAVIEACSAGIKAVQLREKDLTASELMKLAKSMRNITRKHRVKLIINDRVDIALLSNADGVHSPENGIQPSLVKKFNKNFIVGKSTHSMKSVIESGRNGYDYVLFGPVFRTKSKVKFGKPKGISELRKVCKSVNVPVFAIGGITPARAKRCVEAGAYGAAVISSVLKSDNIKKVVREFKETLSGL
jgi:thiamine-phosphate pyrophosphorylase